MSTPRPIDGTLRVPLPVDEAVRVAIRIADVLAAIHRDGHVFRELRPGTVIVGGDGHIRLAADSPGEFLDNYRSHVLGLTYARLKPRPTYHRSTRSTRPT